MNQIDPLVEGWNGKYNCEDLPSKYFGSQLTIQKKNNKKYLKPIFR